MFIVYTAVAVKDLYLSVIPTSNASQFPSCNVIGLEVDISELNNAHITRQVFLQQVFQISGIMCGSLLHLFLNHGNFCTVMQQCI